MHLLISAMETSSVHFCHGLLGPSLKYSGTIYSCHFLIVLVMPIVISRDGQERNSVPVPGTRYFFFGSQVPRYSNFFFESIAKYRGTQPEKSCPFPFLVRYCDTGLGTCDTGPGSHEKCDTGPGTCDPGLGTCDPTK